MQVVGIGIGTITCSIAIPSWAQRTTNNKAAAMRRPNGRRDNTTMTKENDMADEPTRAGGWMADAEAAIDKENGSMMEEKEEQ